jgi:hypothetical protein
LVLRLLLLPLLLLPLLPLLPLAVSSNAMHTALLALGGKAINRSPHIEELSRGLDHFAHGATLCWHLHVKEGLLAAPPVFVCAFLAIAAQPISTATSSVKAVCCQGLPALPAPLLLWHVPYFAVINALSLCAARQAAGFAATPVAGLLGKPSGRQRLVALLADLLLLRRWMSTSGQPARCACTTKAYAGIGSGYLEHGMMPHVQRSQGLCNTGCTLGTTSDRTLADAQNLLHRR